MTLLTPIQTQCETHRDQITAYEEFLSSDLSEIRNERNKIRKPFGLLFELPSPTSSFVSSPNTTSIIKPLERKRKPEQQLQPSRVFLAPSVLSIPSMKSPVRFGKDELTLQAKPPSQSWIIYSDDSSEDSIKIDETEFKDESYEAIIPEEEKDEDADNENEDEEEKNDENLPILWGLDSLSST